MALMGLGEGARKVPWTAPRIEPWASEQVEASHTEAIWAFGEYCLFTLMWKPMDEEAGLVGRCSVCYTNSRSAAAFKQTPNKKCPGCFGTTFEGGFRAQIIRPALWADRNSDTVEASQGTVTIDSIQLETTTDFTFRRGDYIFRGDGTRYQGEEKAEGIVQGGFGIARSIDSFRGSIPSAHREDPASVAFIIPPTTAEGLVARLDRQNFHEVPDLSHFEVIRPNGYLIDGVAYAPPASTEGNVLTGYGPPPTNQVYPAGTEYIDLTTGDVYQVGGVAP